MAETTAPQISRATDLRAGIRLEVLTVIWMVVESVVALGEGLVARSILLTAFGIDSLIELVSGSILLWRLAVEVRGGDVERTERLEHRATWFVAITLALLCAYVLVSSIYGLAIHSKPESSVLGIAISLGAVVVMPWLGIAKRRLADRLDSDALRGDAVESITCGYMAATVLVGVGLNALFRWWWVEDIAALAFLFWLGRETLEVLEEAREGVRNDD